MCGQALRESPQLSLAKFLEIEGVLIPEQGGFRAKRECIEHAVILFETLRRRKAERKATFIGFIDFAKAFDTVWRNGLLFKLHGAGVSGKMLRMIRQLYSKTSASVRVNGQFTDTFPIELGVCQGGAARQDPRLCGFLWADDFALLTEKPEELAKAFDLIGCFAMEFSPMI